MPQHEIENLSALMDGEHQDSTVLGEVVQNSQLSDKWRSYHLVRDTLRKELPVEMHLDIAASIAVALEDEMTILAPHKRGWRKWISADNVVPMMRNVGQYAVAASVAVAVIFGVQSYNHPEDAVPQIQNSQSVYGALGGISPVSLEVEQPQPVAQTDAYEQRRRVIAFLTDHQQQMQRRELHLEPKAQQQKATQSAQQEPQQ